jgi:hypothetical protein
MVSAFSDGSNVYRGLVANISKSGLKITNITSKFRPETRRRYTTIVTSRDKKFKFKILPIWFNKKGSTLEIGFQIVSPPSGWRSYLDQSLA